jgi:hypothetical protein
MGSSDIPLIKQPIINTTNWKTGDILTINYTHFMGKFIRFWSSSDISHPGIVYKDQNNNIFIIEAAYYDKEWKQVMKIPISKWLEYNKNHNIFYSKYDGPKITHSQITDLLEKFKDIKLERFNPGWARFLKKTDYISENERKFAVCYEITIQMLQHLNIMQKKYTSSSYWPSDIAYGRLDLNTNCKYSSPVQLQSKLVISKDIMK